MNRAAKILLVLLAGLACAGAVRAREKIAYGPYRATQVRVIDGDTIELDVYLWPGLVQRIRLRLDGVNTPEKRGKGVSHCEKVAARRATDFTRRFLQWAEVVTISDIKPGKYAGRMLGRLSVQGKDLGKALIAAGLARVYSGGKRKPWC